MDYTGLVVQIVFLLKKFNVDVLLENKRFAIYAWKEILNFVQNEFSVRYLDKP